MLRPTNTQRLKRLLEKGYLPQELPPTFVSATFASHCRALHAVWPTQELNSWKSLPDHFSIPKRGHARRETSIVNPISQYKVARLISFEWAAIRKHLSGSAISEFTPAIDMAGDRAVFPPNYVEIDKLRARVRAAYPRALKTDITAFYGSIYTHSIAWALHGKEWAKQNLNTPALNGSLGGRLDRAVRQGQDNQTGGIPTGPDTSRIVAEIIAVDIDNRLRSTGPKHGDWGLRYVDDYLLGVSPNESDATVSARIAKALRDYGLEINEKKTEIDVIGHNERPSWIRALRAFRFDAGRQQDSIRDFFDMLLSYYGTECDDAVIKYGVKQSRSFPVAAMHTPYLFDRLLHSSRICPATLPAVVQSILERRHLNPTADISHVSRYISSALDYFGPIGYHYEIVWLLYLARGLKLKLQRKSLGTLFALENSAVALVLLDMNQRGLISRRVDESVWVQHANADGLKGSMWLLAYEAAKKGWWRNQSDDYVRSHPLFGPMITRGIYFYDERRNILRTDAELLRQIVQRIRNRRIFESAGSYF